MRDKAIVALVEEEIYDEFQIIAAKHGRSVSSEARYVIRRWIDEEWMEEWTSELDAKRTVEVPAA